MADGKERADDPWLTRARKAFLLQSEDGEAPWPDFILRLEVELRKYLQKKTGNQHSEATDKDSLLKLLELLHVVQLLLLKKKLKSQQKNLQTPKQKMKCTLNQ